MFTRLSFFLLVFLLSLSVEAQESVSFSGTVSRHALGDRSVQVSGTVYIKYAYPTVEGEDVDVSVPFTIPAGQSRTVYSKTLPWDLPGGVPFYGYNFFTIDVQCEINCDPAKQNDELAYYSNAGRTVLGDSRRFENVEAFGVHGRDNAYIVNLALLPNYGSIRGRLALPDGKRATEDIEIVLVGLDYGGCCYSDWIYAVNQRATIRSGENAVNFNFLINEEELALARSGNFRFGYSCQSKGCKTHGLNERAWLTKDLASLITNVSQADLLPLTMKSDQEFSLELSQNIFLLKKSELNLVIPRLNEDNGQNRISGRVIVEKQQTYISCRRFSTDPYKFDLTVEENRRMCTESSYGQEIVNVSEVPFEIEAGDRETTVSLMVEPLNQNSNVQTYFEPFLEHERIRFECDSGCSKMPYTDAAYYAGPSKRFSSQRPGGGQRFLHTSTFYEQPLQLSLRKQVIVNPILELILQDDL